MSRPLGGPWAASARKPAGWSRDGVAWSPSMTGTPLSPIASGPAEPAGPASPRAGSTPWGDATGGAGPVFGPSTTTG
jgi:hypothetical protein